MNAEAVLLLFNPSEEKKDVSQTFQCNFVFFSCFYCPSESTNIKHCMKELNLLA